MIAGVREWPSAIVFHVGKFSSPRVAERSLRRAVTSATGGLHCKRKFSVNLIFREISGNISKRLEVITS